MDLDMWAHPSTQRNLELLKSYGHSVIPVGRGFLASGLEGEGRMAEPADIVSFIESHFQTTRSFKDKKILITAGPTYEHIDPVRFLGNHSSGKMGWAIAEECQKRGAEVTVILGPTSIHTEHSEINVIRVVSAEEMYLQSLKFFPECDVAIFAAAVSDYRPAEVHSQKIKKTGDTLQWQLIKNKDIASEMGRMKNKHQITVGFALETEKEISHAKEKLHKKNLDFIVLNSLNDPGAGFRSDTNKIKIIDKTGHTDDFQLKSKNDVAKDILDHLEKYLIRNDA
jgi:phosphopantothenoylcysteine decarboxylase/phosphopantothenate--cysteine ligase